MAHSGGHIPIDGSNFVTMLVFAVLAKGHSPAFKGTMIFTGKYPIA
jgi:hypothetical protein